MDITFIGDICLGRYVREKFETSTYQFVAQDLLERLMSQNGKVIANLESPVADNIHSQGIRFSGTSAMLSQFKWVDCFSLANNHINDFGEEGMAATIENLTNIKIGYNGLYEKEYVPYLIDDGENKIAIITCADKINRKIPSDSQYRLLYVEENALLSQIKKYKAAGHFVIVYAHMGSMFCRIPNPSVVVTIHKLIDEGCNCLMVSHPHCIGGVYTYKDVLVFYSLGDFLMDGESFRRRRSCSVKLNIIENKIKSWELIPAVTGIDLQVRLLCRRQERIIKRNVEKISELVSKPRTDYKKFYKYQYKKDMLRHSISTIGFTIRTKGIGGLISSLSSRKNDVRGIMKRIRTDRSNMRNG